MLASSPGLLRALRVNAIALLGSDARATRELFKLLDAGAASDYRSLGSAYLSDVVCVCVCFFFFFFFLNSVLDDFKWLSR